ncbi:type IV secretory system conjugative DNA transfer family protein [Caenispirillum bisanense]|uniref:Type IV secretion system protein VirD4 n=1 Tax=Caenispirillum bisanense TaxID=414052 RepID=A0A286GUB5_9PROT|nr:type IV secretory system conjugative DNA transfer family protein [Caenispirillum bisanense]SOD98574.1 type IV secretion system protein VirD4 [Caenispirillum bisanense]
MLIAARLTLIALFVGVLAAILWQWRNLVGFDPSDSRWWIWLWHAGTHPAGLPAEMTRAAYLTAVGGVVGMGALTALMVHARNRTARGGVGSDALHGSARWATGAEVREAGLFAKAGVVAGGWKRWISNRTLQHDGPEHVLCFAPTRSGKGVSLILPTLLSSWRHSVLVLDIKGENYALTAGWRASLGHTILKFDPTAATGSARFNPLAEIRIGTGRDIADCQNVALMIVDGDGKGLKDYWMKEGWAWLSTALLHVLYRIRRDENRTATLADVNAFLSGVVDDDDDSDEGGSFTSLLDDMIGFAHGDPVIDAEVQRGANRMKLKAPQERSGVHSSAITGMALFADPLVAANTAASDFTVADLMHGAAPAALYLMVPPSDIGRVRPLLRIMMTLILSRLTESMAFADGRSVAGYQHRLLLLLDEFTSIGKLEIVEKALAYMAGYGIKAFLIVQDLAQLNEAYGRDEAVTGNCHVRIAFAPNKIETAKALSDLAGKATIVQHRRSRSGRVGEIGSVSDSLQETARPLLTADEAMRLRGIRKDRFGRVRPGEVLTFVAGHPAIRGVQRLYFQDRALLKRARLAPPPDRKAGASVSPPASPSPAPGDQTHAA